MLNGLIWLELMTLLRWAAERPAVSMNTAAGIENRAAAVRVDCCQRRDRS
ncbi:hypothetical protein [Dehalogenimonas alkenigignens]|nr:hypothetical protein [Dehalogenimonas alkenigignens]